VPTKRRKELAGGGGNAFRGGLRPVGEGRVFGGAVLGKRREAVRRKPSRALGRKVIERDKGRRGDMLVTRR